MSKKSKFDPKKRGLSSVFPLVKLRAFQGLKHWVKISFYETHLLDPTLEKFWKIKKLFSRKNAFGHYFVGTDFSTFAK